MRAHPRGAHFKENIIQAFYDGIHSKPETTFGNVKADVLVDKEPKFHRGINFCTMIRGSAWRSRQRPPDAMPSRPAAFSAFPSRRCWPMLGSRN